MAPQKKNFFRPQISASLPRGTRVIAAARRKEEGTQLKVSAVMDRSCAMTGRATLTLEPINGVIKALRVVAQSTMDSCFLSAVMPSRFAGYGQLWGKVFWYRSAKQSFPEASIRVSGMAFFAFFSISSESLRMSHWAWLSERSRAK